jgi:hypothetical protein
LRRNDNQMEEARETPFLFLNNKRNRKDKCTHLGKQ